MSDTKDIAAAAENKNGDEDKKKSLGKRKGRSKSRKGKLGRDT